MRKFIISWLIIIICAPCTGFAEGESVTLDHVDGLHATDSIEAGPPIVFHLRMTFGDDTYWGIANGFRVYSPDGADWDTLAGAWSGAITDSMFPRQYIVRNGVTGTGADTIGFAALLWDEGTGILPYFDDTTCSISIGPIGVQHVGKTICLDSSFCPPAIKWMWASSDVLAPAYIPTWDGPHCFTIVSCCQLRGDIDHNGIGPDIADYVYFSYYMFQSGPPPACMEEANVDGIGGRPGIADLMYLRAYLFGNPPGPAPVPCP